MVLGEVEEGLVWEVSEEVAGLVAEPVSKVFGQLVDAGFVELGSVAGVAAEQVGW